MKKFLKRIFLFFSFVLIANFIFYQFFDYPRNDYLVEIRESRSYLFGDSHAQAFKQKLHQLNYFNFSYGSDNLIDISRKINHLLTEKFLKPGDTVFLEIDLHLFSNYRDTKNNNDISGIYINDTEAIINYYLPLLGEAKLIDSKFFLKGLNELDSRDFVQLKTKKDSLAFHKRFELQFGSNFSLQSNYKNKLKELIDLGEENKITIVGMHFPLHPYYNQLFDDKYDHSLFMDTVKMIMESNLVLDYSRLFDADSNFVNQDHISDRGAKLLGYRFKNDLKSIVTD